MDLVWEEWWGGCRGGSRRVGRVGAGRAYGIARAALALSANR